MVSKYLREVPWIVFVAYWIVSALKTRRTEKQESFGWRYGIMFLEAVGLTLLFSERAGIGVLGRKAIPRTLDVRVLAGILIWAGIGLALWARWHLGQYWSGRITIKQDHKLIRTGPYARLRHPIYSGLDLAAIGTALSIDRWRCFIGICVIVLGFWVKAKREEAMLARQFGAAFEEHKQHTGFLLPRLRRSRANGETDVPSQV